MNYPDWTDNVKGLSSHRGLWPLGLEPVGFSFARQLLPGLTNATTGIRYYSFFSWAFWTYDQQLRERGSTEFDVADQKRWLSRLENLFRAATLYCNPNIVGLAGKSSAVRLNDSDEFLELHATDVPSGFVPALYSASWRNLRCGEITPHGVRLSEELGRPLAQAYQATLENVATKDEIGVLLSGSPTVPASIVRKIAEAMQLRPVTPGEPEHPELLELLFRTRHRSSNLEWRAHDANRSRSLALLLEFAQQGNGTIEDRFDIHRIFASGQLPDKRHFEVPGPYMNDFLIWQRYQERQYEKISLYGFWAVVYDAIRARPRTARQICRWVQADLERSPILSEWLGDNPLRLTVAQAEEFVSDRYRSLSYPDLAADDLRNRILKAEPPADRAGASLLLLLLVVVTWRERRRRLPEWADRIHQRYGRGRLALAVVVEDLQGLRAESVSDLVERVVEVYVLSQSLQVALEKFARGEVRFFIARGGKGFQVVRHEDPRSRLEYDRPRLEGAYRLLQGLGLVDLDAGYKITDAGRSWLEKLKRHHAETSHRTEKELRLE